RQRLRDCAEANGERLLETPGNTISFAITLRTLTSQASAGDCRDQAREASPTVPEPGEAAAFLGSMLFTRCVSGTRVVSQGQDKTVGGIRFEGYGAGVRDYPHAPYLTAACAVGLGREELDEFAVRLDKALRRVK
ncbi:unnamed protein product, partial [Choristocarpus tenellus]